MFDSNQQTSERTTPKTPSPVESVAAGSSSADSVQGSDIEPSTDPFYYSRQISLLYDDDPDDFLRIVVPRFGQDHKACASKILKTYQGLS